MLGNKLDWQKELGMFLGIIFPNELRQKIKKDYAY